MTYTTLSLVILIGLLGPLLALPESWRLPVVFGELTAGIVCGHTGWRLLNSADPTFTFLANLGFALVMFVAGTHVPLGDPVLRQAWKPAVLRAVAAGAVAAGLAAAISRLFSNGHVALYTVLLASSSAALILPATQSLRLEGAALLQLVPQVALADAVSIVALPLAIDPGHAPRAAVGALLVVMAAAVLYLLLAAAERSGLRRRLHRLSDRRKLALELRINLVVLFALCALAVAGHVSIMLAGFSYGLVVAAIGQPRRLARQLFALAEGFLGPLFFVWFGASLDLRALAEHPAYVLLGIALAAGAVLAHLVGRLTGQPLAYGLLASAQLGLPVAATTIGQQLGVLGPGEAAALMLGALITIAVAVLGGRLASRPAAPSELQRPVPA